MICSRKAACAGLVRYSGNSTACARYDPSLRDIFSTNANRSTANTFSVPHWYGYGGDQYGTGARYGDRLPIFVPSSKQRLQLLLRLESNGLVKLCAWLLGTLSITWSCGGSFVYGSELFPTAYRAGCLGICSVVVKVATTFAPALRTLVSL